MKTLNIDSAQRIRAVNNMRARLTGNENGWTSNGYDPLWVEAINAVFEDREVDIRISDIDESLWDRFIGPMCDEIENEESEAE